MTLRRYWEKRNFDKTPEPRGRSLQKSGNRFVIQEHWASHHHFDFRLEMDGVLKSWAVPKGLPEKIETKRLAVQTEDHPVSYIDFEGEIPPGCYGAGTVKIFDKGRYELLERKKDRILFELDGKKNKGRYLLLKMKGKKNLWLIMKIKKDEK